MRNTILLISFLTCITTQFILAKQTDEQKDSTPLCESFSFDNGWHFHKGDIQFPVITGHEMTYSSCKAGNAFGAASPDYDDTNWQLIKLPHDWAVEEGYDNNANLSQGYRNRGIGWYRRNFKIPGTNRGKYIELQFGGIATHCTVWVNGTLVHRNWCGYTSFYIDITALAKYGDEENNIAIRVDANPQEGWWYEGAGIYRHSWLVVRSPLHIITDGVYANPIKMDNAKWIIPIEATLQNTGKKSANVNIEVTLYDQTGKRIVQNTTSAFVNTLDIKIVKLTLAVPHPHLWSIDQPTLYQVRTVVTENGKLLDEVFDKCGFRSVKFTPDSGFYLNGQHVEIKGTCNHQDHAGVGVAVPTSLLYYRLKKLKEMGSNAVRCAHNPPSKEFLDACDRLGILVMDENRNFNVSPEYLQQLEWMIRRDRNHPSVILWSVFNEEPMQGTEQGYEMVRRMSAVVKSLDTTRYVTAAQSGGLFDPINVSQAVDVVGFNYQNYNYDRFHKEHPKMCLINSEDVSSVMQRGQYVTNMSKHLLDSYDDQFEPWGTTHRFAWEAIAKRPFMAGCFVWTGFDYRGEPTPFNWPSASSNFGIMDLCGFPKAAFYLHQAQWIENKPILFIAPHWNWPKDSIGKNIKVMIFTNADKVKLILNGKYLFEKSVNIYEMITENVPFHPGKLEAIGYKNDKEVSRFIVETTDEPICLKLVPDRNAIVDDGCDVVPITVQAVDAKGRIVPTSNIPVEFEVSGAGTIIGLGNGDPNSHEPEKGNKRSLFNGLAQVILQSKEGKAGILTLTAKSNGLKSATISINAKDTLQIPTIPVPSSILVLNNWKMSPCFTTRPNPNQTVATNDQNSWSSVKIGHLQTFTDGKFAVYRTSFQPYEKQQKIGAKIILKNVVGKAEIWIDNQKIADKTTFDSGDMTITLPPADGVREMNILIETEQGKNAGLGGIVNVIN